MKLLQFYVLTLLSSLLFFQGVKAQNSSLCVEAEIQVREGETTITCEPGAPGWIRFKTSKVNTPYAYAVTDQEGLILRYSISDRVSFFGLPGGELRVYAVSYIGLVTGMEGENLFNSALASVCSAISPNYISVLNIVPEGGTVQSGYGRTTEYICTDDELADVLSFETSETNEPIYAYIVTDADNRVLSTSADGTVDFTNNPMGVFRVWGIAYTGALLAGPGNDILSDQMAEGCYDVSDNYVSVVSTTPDGATVTANGGTDAVAACDYPGGTEFPIVLGNTNEQTFSYGYLITDEAETTYTVVEGNTIQISDLPAGNSRVRGISFAGQLAAGSGAYPDFATAMTGCFDLSDNFVTLTRIYVDGGQITLADGSNSARPCGIDGLPDEFSFQAATTSNEPYGWILTGSDDIILGVYSENLVSIDGFPDLDDFRVYGFSYRGEILPAADQALSDAVLVDGCFEVSANFVTITRIEPDGGTVSLSDGSTEFSGCDSPDIAGQVSIDLANDGKAGFAYTYFLTDINNKILKIITGSDIPLSDLPKGASRIWGVSYEGELVAKAGDNPATSAPVAGCYDLSDNFISLQRTVVDGGDLSIFGGGDSALTCGNDDIPDAFAFSSTTIAKDQAYVLVVTDQNNRVFSTANGGIIDFDLFAPGTYRIWGLSYTGSLTVPFGSILTNIAPSTGCYDLSNTFVTIRQEEVNGGQLQFAGGGTQLFTCPGDGKADIVQFLHNGFTSDNYVYLITDDNNLILDTTTDPAYDFEAGETGIRRIWGLAYSGALNAPVGAKADTLVFSDECYSLTSNFLTVVREMPVAGSVSLQGGATMAFTCPGDGKSDLIEFVSTSTYPGMNIFLITGEDNRVIDVSFTGLYDFDFALPGNCRVWAVAFTGNWIIQEGSLITEEPLSDDCWAISDNYVTVMREQPTAGSISFADGSDLKYTCPGDGQPDVLSFSNTSTYPGSTFYLITDDNNKIIASTTADSYDFDLAGVGVSRVWAVAYTGELTFLPGDDATLVNISDDCFDISDNFITVIRENPLGGQITSAGGNNLTLCVGDVPGDVVQLSVTGVSNTPYTYLVTDVNGILLDIMEEDASDFNDAGGGISRIYGLAYTGELTITPGDNVLTAPLSSDCYDLSENFVTISRLNVDGNVIATGSGATDIEFICSPDGASDVITFQNGNTDPQVSYQYLITATNNQIIGDLNSAMLDLEGSPFDSIRVWGVAYTGNATLPIGQNITAAILSDSCYDVSNNFITLVNGIPDGGMIAAAGGLFNIRVCIGGESGLVEMGSTSTSLAGYVYIATTTDGIIAGVSDGNVLDFNALAVGNYLIYGLSYTGQLSFNIGDNINEVELATSCFELSANTVQAERTPPLDGGTITSAFGDPLYVCLGDGLPDIGAFETTSSDPNYRYVITDTLNRIVIPDIIGNVVDFDKATPGFGRVYGVSFTGSFTASVGDNIFEPLSNLCSAVSSNYITLVRDRFDGGTVSTADGATEVTITAGDGIADLIAFDSSATSGLSYTYLITDENNAVLSIPAGDSEDFESISGDTARVWGLAYSGELTIEAGDIAGSDLLSTGCFDLSANFITVIINNEGEPLVEEEEESSFQYQTPGPKLHVYPNPVSYTLRLQLSVLEQRFENAGQVTIEVFDVSGRRWNRQQQALHTEENLYELDVRELPIGMYILQVSDGNNRMIERFFKQ